MKKFYYGEQNEVVERNDYHNSDNERRKFLSLETNRRRRDMALRVKRQIEREEERRIQVLQERKEKQDALNSKIRMKKKKMDGQPNEDLENILEGVRRTGRHGRQKESRGKVLDLRSENCVSPMARYSGLHDSSSMIQACQDNLRTYETQVLQQEQQELRQYHKNEADLFTQTLEQVARPSVGRDGDDNRMTGSTFRKEEFRKPKPTPRTTNVIIENLEVDHVNDDDDNVYDDGSIEDSIEINVKSAETKPVPKELFMKSTLESEKEENIKVSVVFNDDILKGYEKNGHDVNNGDDDNYRKEEIHYIPSLNYCGIKGILKKNGTISRFDSNPDLSGRIDYLRDSLDLTKLRNNSKHSTTMYRSSSLSDNSINHNESGTDDESRRKYVRFADQLTTQQQRMDDPVTKMETSSPSYSHTSSQQSTSVTQMRIQNAKYDSIHKLSASKTIPNSTALKPPLHPRTVPSTQDGSYLQTNFKRPPQPYQPPPRPKKINVDVLDRELSTLLVVNKRPSSQNETGQVLLSSPPTTSTTISTSAITPPGIPRRTPTGDHPLLYYNSLDKTPTEAEIDELWREVRECLSRTRNASRTGSVANGPASIRTAESAGSDNNSIQSAPSQQYRMGVSKTPPFHVKHHITVKPTHFPGQEPILKDRVTVHNNTMASVANNIRHISQQPLTIVEDHKNGGLNQVSDSLEEFLAMEQASKMLSTPRQVSNNVKVPPSPSRIFIHRPLSQARPQLRPKLIHGINYPSEHSNRSTNSTQRTQLSIDEDRVKLSLDRLNEKLRNVTSH